MKKSSENGFERLENAEANVTSKARTRLWHWNMQEV